MAGVTWALARLNNWYVHHICSETALAALTHMNVALVIIDWIPQARIELLVA
jgi:hypothetical protein